MVRLPGEGPSGAGDLLALFSGPHAASLLGDTEALLQDTMARIPSIDKNLLALQSLPLPPDGGCPAGDAAGAADAATAAAGMPRVGSLDYIRAFLNARHSTGAAEPPALEAAGEEPACSGTALPALPRVACGLPPGAELPPALSAGDVDTPTGLPPPAIMAAFIHSHSLLGGGASSPMAVDPMVPAASLGMVPTAAPAPTGDADADAAPPSRPASTAPSGSDCRTPGGRGAPSKAPSKATTGPTTAKGSKAGGSKAGGGKPALTQAEKLELRRARRMLSNRESARRSRKRKQDQISELEARAKEAQDQAAEERAKAARLATDNAKKDEEIASLRRQLHALKRLLPVALPPGVLPGGGTGRKPAAQ